MDNSQLETTISAPLSLWQEHHSIELRQQSENIFVIKDLEKLDFHLISFSHGQVDLANNIKLNISVKKAQDCQTNLTVYLTAGVCFAIIDLDDLEVLSGKAKEREGAVLITEKADGWIDLIIEIKLDFPSPIYLGCSLGNQPVYEGCGKDQFYIQDSVFIEILDLHLKYLKQVQDLVQDGELSEAIALYHSQIEQPLTDEQMYERIWKGLNELGIMPKGLIKDRKINKENALRYFAENSQYQMVFLSKNISPELDQLIKNVGLSREYLTIILGNIPQLEETYIRIRDNIHNFSFSRKQTRKKNFKWPRLNEDLDFQQSLVETGYIYIMCPFRGEILKSNHSFSPIQSEPHIIAYRFQSIEIFYLITGHWGGSKLYLYFPSQELLIYMNEAAKELISLNYITLILNHLKANLVSHWHLVKQYISNNLFKKKVVAITGVMGNLGHFWFNNLTGIEYLFNNELLQKLEKILVAQFCYFDISAVFPEIESTKFISIKDNSIDLFRFCLENNYVLVYPSNTYITANLAQRVCNASFNQAEPNFLEKVAEAKQNFPLLWINLRSHNKIWVSQISGYIQIITNLANIYPNLAIVFDGLPAEKAMMVEIQSAIPEYIKTYSALECKLSESVIWAQAIDAYIAVVGSGLTLVTWIANKPGIVHADLAHMGQMLWWQEVRPDAVLPISVPKEHIQDIDPDKSYANYEYTDYECDWLIVYELLLGILKTLPIKIDTNY